MTAFIKICKLSTNEYLFKYDKNEFEIQQYKFPIDKFNKDIRISQEIITKTNITSFKNFVSKLNRKYPIENKFYILSAGDVSILNDSVIYIKYNLEFIEMLNYIEFHQSRIQILKQSLKKLTDKNHINISVPIEHYHNIIKYYMQEQTKAYIRINTFKKKVLNLQKIDDSEFEESEESNELLRF